MLESPGLDGSTGEVDGFKKILPSPSQPPFHAERSPITSRQNANLLIDLVVFNVAFNWR